MGKIREFIGKIDKKIDIRKFVKFGITGIINTAIDFLVYTLCLEVFGTGAVVAQPIGQGVAMINSYLMNKNWTFKKREKYNLAEILKFLLVNGGSLAINTLGVYLLHEVLGLNEYLCKIPVAISTILVNYFGNKLFVFV
ncbi:MAG: GtrA family protein [Oscillospiraceae bacterium]|nr:GtrA family protein [Oscillospiraceae bacterium]